MNNNYIHIFPELYENIVVIQLFLNPLVPPFSKKGDLNSYIIVNLYVIIKKVCLLLPLYLLDTGQLDLKGSLLFLSQESQ